MAEPVGETYLGSRRIYVLSPVIAGLIWGSTAPVSKLVLLDITPWDLIIHRSIIAALAFLAIMRLGGQRRGGDVGLGGLVSLALTGVVAPWILYNVGLLYVNANQAGIIVGSYPLMTALVSYAVIRERLTKRRYGGIAVGFLGLLVFFSEKVGYGGGAEWFYGAGLVMAATFLWAVYAVLLKIVGGESLGTTGRMFLLAVPLNMAAAYLFQGPFHIPSSPPSLAGTIWLGLFSSALAYYIFNLGSERVSATLMATSGLLIPLTSALIAYPMLGETMTLLEAIGAGLVIAGLAAAIG